MKVTAHDEQCPKPEGRAVPRHKRPLRSELARGTCDLGGRGGRSAAQLCDGKLVGHVGTWPRVIAINVTRDAESL